MQEYLKATDLIDADHPAIKSYAERMTNGARIDMQKAVRIYYTVRDGWKYNPYNINMSADAMRASSILAREEGHCLDKAILMIALLRAVDVPARLRLAKVRNHIAAERLVEFFGTDELTPHGYVEVWLNDRWVKATPSFNQELCEKLGVNVLEFDGRNDSIFQEFDKADNKFMEYLEDYGAFADVPLEFILANLREHYPRFYNTDEVWTKEKFMAMMENA
jgi:transglutaminase-like putative cysteine protease